MLLFCIVKKKPSYYSLWFIIFIIRKNMPSSWTLDIYERNRNFSVKVNIYIHLSMKELRDSSIVASITMMNMWLL